MSKRVWKYLIKRGTWSIETMPRGAKPLTVQTQDDVPMLLALVDPDERPEPRWFRTVATGQELPDDAPAWAYIGTFQVEIYVFHVFEVQLPDANE